MLRARIQTVKTDVSLGYYDHLKKCVVVPDKEWYALGLFDRDAWEETDQQWEDMEIEPNTFGLNITITRSNLPNASGVFPKVDDLITEHRVDVEAGPADCQVRSLRERAAEQALAADASIACFLTCFLAPMIECLRSARLKRNVGLRVEC